MQMKKKNTHTASLLLRVLKQKHENNEVSVFSFASCVIGPGPFLSLQFSSLVLPIEQLLL